MRLLIMAVMSALWATVAQAQYWAGDWKTSDGTVHLVEYDKIVIGDLRPTGTNFTQWHTILGVKKGTDIEGVILKGVSIKKFRTGVVRPDRFQLAVFDFDLTGKSALVADRVDAKASVRVNSLGLPRGSTDPFAGTWNSSFGELRLASFGDRYVVGDYADRGVIIGANSNGTLRGFFTNGDRVGEFVFRLVPPDQITGTWNWRGSDSKGEWTGSRTSTVPVVVSNIFGGEIDTAPKQGAAKPPAGDTRTYRERETAAMKSTDQCGPQFLTEYAPDFVATGISGEMKKVCERHDACFRLKEQTQKFCDDQMTEELWAVCETKPWYLKSQCQTKAMIFARLIRTSIGGDAYGGAPQGEIADWTVTTIDDTFSDDEIEICARIYNNSDLTQEYELRLYTFDPKPQLIDKEPDTYEFNVQARSSKSNVCVSTNLDPTWSKSDLKGKAWLILMADIPDDFSLDNMGKLVVVDQKKITW